MVLSRPASWAPGQLRPHCHDVELQILVPTQEPFKPRLTFDATADFHVYELEWTKTSARFSVDGALLYLGRSTSIVGLPRNVLLTIWASSSADWAGPSPDGERPSKL